MTSAAFRAPWWARSPHLQTLWGPLLRRTGAPARRRETLPLADGDYLLLDWCGPAPDGQLPVLLLQHGLSGSSDSHYIIGIQRRLLALGLPSVAANGRGALVPNDTARSYHAGEIDDLNAVIEHVHARAKGAPVLALGVSLGASRLLNWLALADSGKLAGALAICAPLQLANSADHMDQGFSRIYRNHLIKALLATLDAQERHLHEVNPEQAAILAGLDRTGIRSFWDFDGRIVAPLYGFRDAADYYAKCSAGTRLGAIDTPTWLLQARDDPFMTEASLPRQQDLSDAVTLEVAEHGGHVGFVQGSIRRPHYWLEQRAEVFVRAFSSDHQSVSAAAG
ncbi:hypothetical protein SAMN05877962_110101 [Alloalcanivorax xenomutans]|uniref:YheT family hydrolase n=1 Tax=Alloalcanivorax xenomutans TaxID=1094342 RepID=UPI000BCEDF3C|nr:alpha/beta fold hydrolase [Alloalcanivorax xenomutans]SOC10427.1 hypothetical protein SAMN05877962_110101 [Alloalcanivorax xenomutans]|tara:strand:- start:649 stop:1659 length:1011 start_codon:yes stop_codon:yes gene_type:complete